MLTAITAVYNTSAEHLRQCVNSIRRFDLTHIIVDDGSTKPETIEFLRSIPHIRLAENIGEAGAYLIAAQNVKTEWLLKIDSDDVLIKEPIIQEDADICVNSFGGKVFIDFDSFCSHPYCALNGAIIRTGIALKYFGAPLPYMEDVAIFATMLRNGVTAKYHPEDNYFYRIHPNQKSAVSSHERAKHRRAAMDFLNV